MARGRKSKVAGEAEKDPPLVYIEWLDHHANGSWQDQLEHHPAICLSVGWIAKEDSKGLTIAGSKAPGTGSTVGNTQYILKNCIVKRTVIKA